MNIALFTDTYDEVNGVANTFRHLTDYCQAKNRRLDIYAYTDKDDHIETRGSVRILRYKPRLPVDIYFDMIFDLKVARFRLFRDFQKTAYDLVHLATPGSIGLTGLLAARHANCPIIGSYHTALPDYVRTRVEKLVQKFKLPTSRSPQRTENLTWDYLEWFYNHPALVLAPSQSVKKQLTQRLKTPVDIFSRGIDTDTFHPRRRQHHDNHVVVLYVGRVSLEKNLAVLVDIFRDKQDAQLVIVGDGPYLPEMKQLLPHADFRGFLKGDDLSTAYASADIFVFPSTADTFGNVVLEAMASKIPVIVTDKMGPKEIVNHDHTGFVTHSPADFAQKLDLLIHNPARRQQMGQNARQYALNRSWNAVFDTLFQQYQAVAQTA